MNATTLKSTNSFQRLFAAIMIVIAAFCLAISIVPGQAFAVDENIPKAPVDNSTAQNSEESQAGAASAPSSTQSDGAETTENTTSAAGNGSVANPDLNAASDTSYPGDAGTMGVFIGLAPTSSKTCDITNATTSRDQSTNAVYVDLQCQVGDAIDLAVAVDYMRFGEDVYDSRGASRSVVVNVPEEETDDYIKTYTKDGAVYTWYSTQSPLGQGTYYSDPSTNPALAGGSVSQASNLESYDVNIDDFIDDRGASWRRGKAKVAVRPTQWSFKGTLYLPEKNEIGADSSYRYMQSPFYFEEAGQYTFVAQFTYMEEYRSKNTVDELVGRVLYASNPVVYRITVTPKTAVTVQVIAYAEDVGLIEFTNNDTHGGLEKHEGFYVDLEKRYYKDPEADNNPYLPADMKEHYYEYTWCNRNLRGLYQYATPGTYRLTVIHEDGKYEKYVDANFVISDADYQQALALPDRVIYKYVELTLAPPVLHTISFYMDDGTFISSGQYNKGTAAENINRPANPTKPTTEYYSYEFYEWEAKPLNGGELEHGVTRINWLYPVTCDTDYVAVFKETLLKNNAGQKIVYATGGLFSNNALPNGVLGYSLSSEQLTSSQKASVIAAHPDAIAAERVLGMIQVDLKQHNDDEDRTTTAVTESEGLDGMRLRFNMQESGIDASDGDNLTILQIHKKYENSPEEIIEHQATVENGEVELTLNGKLSTFVFLKAAADEPDSGESGDTPSGGSPDEPSGGSNTEGSGEGSAGQPATGRTEGEKDGESTTPAGEAASGNEQGQGSEDAGSTSGSFNDTGKASSGGSAEQAADAVGGSGSAEDEGSQDALVRAVAPLKSEEASSDGDSDFPVDGAKAAPASTDASLPATGDSLCIAVLALMFVALSALASLFAYGWQTCRDALSVRMSN